MEVDTLLKRLQKARYFEGYSEAAVVEAVEAIRKRYAAGIAGPYKSDFERFPGLSLVVIDLEHELIGRDDLKQILKQLGAATFATFVPKNTRIRRQADENRYSLEFRVNGTGHAINLPDDSWIPNEFFEELDKITTLECKGLAFHAVAYPEPSQSGFYLWCTPRAYRALSRAKLIPSSKHPLHASGSETLEQMAEIQQETNPAPIPKFSPPEDPLRAERIKLFKNGQWIVPVFSANAVENWREVEVPQLSSLSRKELITHINRAFDLLCARHCGVLGLGDPVAYAKQVIALVEYFLFGTPQAGHVDPDDELTVEDRKELIWSLGLPAGCATAVSIGNKEVACRFLGYLRGDVRSGPIGDELAYYRLFSDIFMGKTEWDWNEQSSFIEGGFDNRLKILLRCLEALKANDAASFRKVVRKLAKRLTDTMTPLRYSNVVDCEVTLVVDVARRRGWPCDDFPIGLQDQILDCQIFQ